MLSSKHQRNYTKPILFQQYDIFKTLIKIKE